MPGEAVGAFTPALVHSGKGGRPGESTGKVTRRACNVSFVMPLKSSKVIVLRISKS